MGQATPAPGARRLLVAGLVALVALLAVIGVSGSGSASAADTARTATPSYQPVRSATPPADERRDGHDCPRAQDRAPARAAAETFVDAAPEDLRVGAIAFNHETTVLQSPTRDHEAVRSALRSVTAAGSTATGDALQSVANTGPARSGTRRCPAARCACRRGRRARGRA
jgi:Ca-activated chloride channel family protein